MNDTMLSVELNFLCFTRVEKILVQLQERDFLRDLKFLPFYPLLRSREKEPNPVKNRVLESYSNIVFPLANHDSK